MEKRQIRKDVKRRADADVREFAEPNDAALKQYLEEERDLPTDAKT